jgi:hypothetical protein
VSCISRSSDVFKLMAVEEARRVQRGAAFIPAVDRCWHYARDQGLADKLGVDFIQRVMAEAFAPVRGSR